VEHEISIVTALQAINAFDKEKYEVVPVYIAKTGEMYTGDALLDIDNYRDLKKLVITATRVVPVSEGDEILLMKYPPAKIFGNNEVNRIQIAFPIVHGTNVEDGTLQGFFELYNVPYVGCDVMSSAIGMDKVIMKKVLKDGGIPIVDYQYFYFRDWRKNSETLIQCIEEKIGYPVIIKPANLGSSVGISKASNRADLEESVELAGKFAMKIIVERAITNLREINCPVIGEMLLMLRYLYVRNQWVTMKY
jgi:D-alanine-D-alanine ligase